MNRSIDVTLSSWSLGLNSPSLRKPFRRPALRHPDFEDRYDFQSVFYDCFRSADGTGIRLVGPPLHNLGEDLGLRFFAMPSGEELRVTVLPRVFVSLIDIAAPPTLQALRIESAAGTAFIVPQPNLSGLFAGRRVLVTLSQNNELAWIRDWIVWHQRLHGCDAALVYDNNSTRYDISELKGCLAAIPGVTGLAVSWPFRYGPFDGRLPLTYDLWEGHFCQFGMLEHARFRFLAEARSALNLDIDELVICPDGESVCALTEASRTGFLKFSGKWVEPFASQAGQAGAMPLHRHFRHRRTGRTQGCENKYTVVPSRVPDSAQFGIHDIFGHLASALPEGVELRHFKAINTNWTVDRPGTLVNRTGAGAQPQELAEDTELAALLDRAFAAAPEAEVAPPAADPETAFYRARLQSAQLLRSGQAEAAERQMRAALAASPGWPSALQFHAGLLERTGHPAAAEQARGAARRLQDEDPAVAHERGRYLLHTGDWAGAARSFRQALRKDPGFAPAAVALGRALWSAGRERSAEQVVRRGIASNPGSPLLQGALAEMLLYSGRPRAALDHAGNALEVQPRNIRMLLLRARALRDLDRPEEGLAAAAQAMRLQADGAVMMAQFGAAIDHPFDAEYPDSDPMWSSIECLSCLLRLSRLDAADELSRRLLVDFPDRSQAHEARHQVLEALGRTAEADAALVSAIDCAQRDYDRLPPQTLGRYKEWEWHEGRVRRLVHLLCRVGRDDEAALLLKRELALNPGSDLLALQLRHLLAQPTPPGNARELIETALGRLPRDYRLWQEYGRVLEADGDMPGAIAAYRKALRLGPAQTSAFSHLAYLLARHCADDPEAVGEAEGLLREVLARDDRHALSHSRLGDILWRTDRREEALAEWRTATRLAPGEAWLWSHLGGKLTEAGHLREAGEVLRRALKMSPDDALTLYRLARLHEKEGDLDLAIEQLSHAVALAPAEDWMWQHYDKLLARAGRGGAAGPTRAEPVS